MASFKMYLTTAVVLILGTIFSTDAQSQVPVLLWESSNVGENAQTPAALSAIDVDEFADVLMRRVDRNSPVVVLFSEDSLSVEDFSRHGSGIRPSFPALQSIKGDVRLEFLPAVQTPVKALNRLSKLGYKWEDVSGEVLPEAGKKILVVHLGGAKPDEERSDMLLRHDKAIASLFKQMTAKYSQVLAVYTGRRASWKTPSYARVRRDTESTSSTGTNEWLVTNGTDQIMLYTSAYPVLTINSNSYNLTGGVAVGNADARKTSTKMTAKFMTGNTSDQANIKFKFNTTGLDWKLTGVELVTLGNQVHQVLLEPTSKIGASASRAYICGQKTVFQNSTYNITLTLRNIKVQPGVKNSKMGYAENCVPTFTIPIWSGLIVTFLLLFIVAWGIDMMMNIHTNDRFDDPKGKPLVFNAQE